MLEQMGIAAKAASYKLAQLSSREKNQVLEKIADYLEAHGFRAERVAIELNGEIIPRDKRADAMLDDQCVMEIVQFVQGG